MTCVYIIYKPTCISSYTQRTFCFVLRTIGIYTIEANKTKPKKKGTRSIGRNTEIIKRNNTLFSECFSLLYRSLFFLVLYILVKRLCVSPHSRLQTFLLLLLQGGKAVLLFCFKSLCAHIQNKKKQTKNTKYIAHLLIKKKKRKWGGFRHKV